MAEYGSFFLYLQAKYIYTIEENKLVFCYDTTGTKK